MISRLVLTVFISGPGALATADAFNAPCCGTEKPIREASNPKGGEVFTKVCRVQRQGGVSEFHVAAEDQETLE